MRTSSVLSSFKAASLGRSANPPSALDDSSRIRRADQRHDPHGGPYKMPKLKILQKTPASLGYSFPPEWHPHSATWCSWPRPEGISFPGKYQTVPENLARIIRETQSREQVHINVPNENWQRIVREQLKECGCPLRNIFFHYIKT